MEVCEALGAIGNLDPAAIRNVIPNVLAKLSALANDRDPQHDNSHLKVSRISVRRNTLFPFFSTNLSDRLPYQVQRTDRKTRKSERIRVSRRREVRLNFKLERWRF